MPVQNIRSQLEHLFKEFFAGGVFATISSNNLPFHTPNYFQLIIDEIFNYQFASSLFLIIPNYSTCSDKLQVFFMKKIIKIFFKKLLTKSKKYVTLIGGVRVLIYIVKNPYRNVSNNMIYPYNAPVLILTHFYISLI